jgi:hypothetical protein
MNKTLYTYDEWENIYRRNKARQMAETAYFIKQKIAGVTALIIGVVSPLLLDGDGTASIILLPLGFYLIATRKHILTL